MVVGSSPAAVIKQKKLTDEVYWIPLQETTLRGSIHVMLCSIHCIPVLKTAVVDPILTIELSPEQWFRLKNQCFVEYYKKKIVFCTNRWVKRFKNGPNRICGRQPLKNLKWYGLINGSMVLWYESINKGIKCQFLMTTSQREKVGHQDPTYKSRKLKVIY